MNNLDFDGFIDKYYYGANTQRVCDVKRFLSRTIELAGSIPLPEKLEDHDFLCDAFYLQKLNSITRTHYQKIKEYLLHLFEWFGMKGEVPSQEDVIKISQVYAYFRDLDSAINFIDNVGKSMLNHYNSMEDLVIIKAIVVLGWYGLSLKNIVELKKTDISRSINGGGIVSLETGQIIVDQNSIDILFALRELDSYQALPSGKCLCLNRFDSHLFRSTASDCSEMRDTYIAQSLNRFNNNVPRHFHQNIAFRNMHRNAMFVAISKDNSDLPLLEKIMKYTHCSPKQAYSYRTQYKVWTELVEQGLI